MEYSLTELGEKFNTVLDAMKDWGTGFIKKKIEEHNYTTQDEEL